MQDAAGTNQSGRTAKWLVEKAIQNAVGRGTSIRGFNSSHVKEVANNSEQKERYSLAGGIVRTKSQLATWKGCGEDSQVHQLQWVSDSESPGGLIRTRVAGLHASHTS